jgi:hypothetical protein
MRKAIFIFSIMVFLSSCAHYGTNWLPRNDVFRHRLLLPSDTVYWDGFCERGPDFHSELRIKGKRVTQLNLLCEDGGQGCDLHFRRNDDDWYIRLGFRWYLFYSSKLKGLAAPPDNEEVRSFNYLVAPNSNIDQYHLYAFKFYFKEHLQEDTRIIWFHPNLGVVAMNSDNYTYIRDDYWHHITRSAGSGS